MKKIFLFSAVLWTVVVIMSVIVAGTSGETEHIDDEILAVSTLKEKMEESIFESGKSFDENYTVQLKRGDEVVEMPLNTYLEGVVAAEMPASFPSDALKAQAVAARTFLLRREAETKSKNGKEGHNGAVICDDSSCCMAYLDLSVEASSMFGANEEEYKAKIAEAVKSTDGQYLTYDNIPILAAFHAVSGGRTENAGDVWQNDVPYLVSVESAGEENAAQYRNDVTYTAGEVKEKFSSAYPKAKFSDDAGEWFQSAVRGDGGVIKTVSVGGIKVRGGTLRSIFNLPSADFTISVGENDVGEKTLTFHTVGYGHGVGMSQYGALAMAQNGCTYEEILHHYYKDVKLCGK